jgi:hypothetical protein
MDSSWKTLMKAGVPLGAARDRPRNQVSAEEIRAALGRIESRVSELEPVARDALYAWLRALQGQWPNAYRRWTGRVGDEIQQAIQKSAVDLDENRYLKLRRIATENLAELV